MVSSFLAGIKTVCWWAAVEIALRKTSVMDLERFILVRIQLRIFPKLNPFLIKRVNLEIINNYALNSIKKNNLPTNGSCHFLFHTSVLQNLSSESSCLNLMNKTKIYLLFYSWWFRIRNHNSGSRKKFRIQPDPDPQHCVKPRETLKISNSIFSLI